MTTADLSCPSSPPAGSDSPFPPGELDLLPDLSKVAAVRPDRKNVIEIPIRRPVTISGLVRERDTARPVAGMQVVLFPPGQSSGVNGATDRDGRYKFQSLAGKARIWASEAPPGFVLPPERDRALRCSGGACTRRARRVRVDQGSAAATGRSDR